jgi:hypothetical protein
MMARHEHDKRSALAKPESQREPVHQSTALEFLPWVKRAVRRSPSYVCFAPTKATLEEPGSISRQARNRLVSVASADYLEIVDSQE